jgi:hypothetical protein
MIRTPIQVPLSLHRKLSKDALKYSGKVRDGGKILTLPEIISFHRTRSLAFEKQLRDAK